MPDPEGGRILNQVLGPNAADRSSDARSPPPPPPPPGSPPQRPSEKPRAATRACERCRQMKVKCEGFDNPPCVRCNKSGKECQFIVLEKIRNHDSREGPPRKRARASGPVSTTYRSLESTPVAQHTTGIPQWTSVQPNSAHTSVSARTSNLGGSARNYVDRVSPSNSSSAATPTVPSIYSTSPLDAVNERDANNGRYSSLQTSEASTEGRRQTQQPIWNLTNTVHSPAPGEELKIPKRDMRGMIKIFCDKLLPYIPVFTIQDFQDADHLIETDLPLVYCICYVAAQFLSRGKHLREMLMPKVTQILNGKLTSGRSQTNDLSTLKALIILYSYANCSPPSAHGAGTTRPEEILYWPLKSLVEVFGLRLGLNRAAYDLQAELRVEKSSPITESTAYQKYTLWLQLFTMAHYASVLTGTPPTIPIDSTIRIAPVLMEPIGACPQARLFGEVELAIIWEKVGTGRELGEWWCLDPSKNVDERETQSVLRQVDQLLDAWYEKWEYFINDEEGRGAVLDYLGRCCRFWLNSYATQHLRTSSTGLNSIQQNQIRTCVKYASHVLDWPLDLSPFEKESLRYIPEAGGTMVAYCCLFIVASYQTFGSILPNFHSDLDKVDAAAQLMVDMAPDSEHSTHQQGLLILKRTASLRKQSRSGNHENDRPDPAGSMESQIAPGLGSQDTVNDMFNFGLPTMDMIWDFSMLVPRTW